MLRYANADGAAPEPAELVDKWEAENNYSLLFAAFPYRYLLASLLERRVLMRANFHVSLFSQTLRYNALLVIN